MLTLSQTTRKAADQVAIEYAPPRVQELAALNAEIAALEAEINDGGDDDSVYDEDAETLTEPRRKHECASRVTTPAWLRNRSMT